MSELYVAVLCMLAITEVPGFFVLRACRFSPSWALCAAPLAGLSLLAIVGQVLALAHITINAVILSTICLGLAILAFVLLRVVNLAGARADLQLPALDWHIILFSLVLGVALGHNLFLSRLGSPDALFQEYDVTWHLNVIQAMADAGRFTSLGVGPYMTAADASIAPVDYSGFYPAAWHVLCAVAVEITGVTVTLAINASMFLLACVVFPVAVTLEV